MDPTNLPIKGRPTRVDYLKKKKKKKHMSLPLPGTTSLASVESLSMPLMQEVVISADMRCPQCQSRVADILSRMEETESISVDVLEKTVTLTRRYSGVEISWGQLAAVNKKPFGKIALIKRILRSSGA